MGDPLVTLHFSQSLHTQSGFKLLLYSSSTLSWHTISYQIFSQLGKLLQRILFQVINEQRINQGRSSSFLQHFIYCCSVMIKALKNSFLKTASLNSYFIYVNFELTLLQLCLSLMFLGLHYLIIYWEHPIARISHSVSPICNYWSSFYHALQCWFFPVQTDSSQIWQDQRLFIPGELSVLD